MPDIPLRRGRALFALGCLCALGGAAVVPYQLALAPMEVELPMPVPLLALVAGLQTGVLCAVLGGLGWLAAGRVGLPTPVLDRLAGDGETDLPTPTDLATGALTGTLLAAGVAALDLLILLPLLPPAKTAIPEGSPALGLLASLYGAVDEEVLTRLFLVSVLAWVLSFPARRTGRPVPPWVIPAAIALAALLFGLLHLPTASLLWEPTPLVLGRILVLNGLLAVPFGWLYWRRGLAVAMLGHLCADLVLHVLVPVLT